VLAWRIAPRYSSATCIAAGDAAGCGLRAPPARSLERISIMTEPTGNTRVIADFVASMRCAEIPAVILDRARLCLADWLGVALGALGEPAARVVHETSRAWHSGGPSTVLLGGHAPAPVAALCNGTLAHCLDFDDTYVKGITHVSAPVWAATLALGEAVGASEARMLRAYIAGFETAARAGFGMGEHVTARGWHGTGVFGRIGSAAAAAVLLDLDAETAVHALGAAATQASGLTASFGTMAKPFHAGKAAMDGIMAAQLAARGFRAAENLLDVGAGLDTALVQDGSARLHPADFSGWEILNNSFKPYAACHLTHPAIDAARQLRDKVPLASVRGLRAEVGALAKQVTGDKSGAPTTPLEGKFDLRYCVALALHGHTLSAADFREPMQLDPAVAATAAKIDVSADPKYGFASARLVVDPGTGEALAAEITEAKGHPGNPIDWNDMREKFCGLVDYAPAATRESVFAALGEFGADRPCRLLEKSAGLSAAAPGER
jgi:2-methylcitrate dehydratase PrpD